MGGDRLGMSDLVEVEASREGVAAGGGKGAGGGWVGEVWGGGRGSVDRWMGAHAALARARLSRTTRRRPLLWQHPTKKQTLLEFAARANLNA